MKKMSIITIILLLTALVVVSGCNKREENQTLINFFGEKKYSELSSICTDKDKLRIATDLIEKARCVMTDTQKKYTTDEVKALERYSFYDPTITNVDVNIELITTEQIGNEGYIWVRYTTKYYYNTDLVSGSDDIISRWTIENDNTQWYVTSIEEP